MSCSHDRGIQCSKIFRYLTELFLLLTASSSLLRSAVLVTK